jgi:hypothetical protein
MPAVNPKRQELETAKEILAEVFDARASDVEEMILARLEERSWHEQRRNAFESISVSLERYGPDRPVENIG